MTIYHIFTFNADGRELIIKELAESKIPYKISRNNVGRIELNSDSSLLHEATRITAKLEVKPHIGTTFTQEDYNNAPYLMVVPDELIGYPQPENNYLESVYDLSTYCKNCGIGAVQKASFRIKSEPKSKKYDAFGLNWVFDEIFVKRKVWEKIFKPIGVEYWPVLIHSKGIESENIVQLKIDQSDCELEFVDYPFEVCPVCNRKRYGPNPVGFYPTPINPPKNKQIFKCVEDFGTGASAEKNILITQDFYKLLQNENISGLYFRAVKTYQN